MGGAPAGNQQRAHIGPLARILPVVVQEPYWETDLGVGGAKAKLKNDHRRIARRLKSDRPEDYSSPFYIKE